MKTVISLLFFSVVCGYSASAQAVSSQRNAQVIEPVETTTAPVQASTTATLVSSGRNPVIREVPVENKQESTEPKNEIMSSERKPK